METIERRSALNLFLGAGGICRRPKGDTPRFFDPITLPGGRKLVTLRDAARYITKLPKAEHDADEWQAAMQALLLVAEHDGPTMYARIGVTRALRRHEPKAAAVPRRKARQGLRDRSIGSISPAPTEAPRCAAHARRSQYRGIMASRLTWRPTIASSCRRHSPLRAK
jgi:hypothetical protein